VSRGPGRRATLVALAALALWGCAPAEAPVAVVDPALAGSWVAVAARRDGAEAPDLIGHVLTFEGAGFRIVSKTGAPLYAGTYSADPAAVPAAIDFVNRAGEAAGQTWLGVYAVADGSVTIADNAPNPAGPRPRGFDAPVGSQQVSVRFERLAPAE
jgi:uncharacterized protein (TIGR03067 family)